MAGHPELEAEQAYIDHAYDSLASARERTCSRASAKPGAAWPADSARR